jgi:hypothetical protein
MGAVGACVCVTDTAAAAVEVVEVVAVVAVVVAVVEVALCVSPYTPSPSSTPRMAA